MNVTCQGCGQTFDDARRSTICPHGEIMPAVYLAQKDRATKMLGKDIAFALAPGAASIAGEQTYRIQSIAWDGMITIDKLPGQFAPHLFRVVEPDPNIGYGDKLEADERDAAMETDR